MKNELISYTTILEAGEDEIVEKKSRFIAVVRHVESEEEALAFIESQRKKYWDARHCCYAYVLGRNPGMRRCSDDGEPAQTAGMPILSVLDGAGLTDVVCTVTRYFGGTLLGTGGLVRAYTAAAQAGCAAAGTVDRIPGVKLTARFSYGLLGKLQYLIAKEGIEPLDSVYTDVVCLTLPVPLTMLSSLKAKLVEATGGQIDLSESDPEYLDLRR